MAASGNENSDKKGINFEYIGIDKNNNRVTGELTSKSLAQARKSLITQGINILRIKKKGGSIALFKSSKVKPADIALFTRQLATMLIAGIPLVQGLVVIAEGIPDGPLAQLIRKIRIDIEAGGSFSSALKKNPQCFDPLFCNLVESGEQSGTLDTMLERIAVYREKTESLKKKIKKALYYPVAVVVVAIIVTIILLVKVVPTFEQLFHSFGAELPGFTQFVLNISIALRFHGLTVFGITFAILFFLVQFHRRNKAFQHLIQKISLKAPVFGNIIKKSIIARFARTISITSTAGVPLIDALDSIAEACGNIIYSNAIQSIKSGVAMGQQMKTAMKKTNIFPPMVVQMVGIGEESGSLEKMLEKVATIYEEEVDAAVDGLATLLEPMIMVILGVIVGGLVIAMYLPIFKLGSVV